MVDVRIVEIERSFLARPLWARAKVEGRWTEAAAVRELAREAERIALGKTGEAREHVEATQQEANVANRRQIGRQVNQGTY